MDIAKPRFVCSYMGEAEYDWRGNRYCQRSFCQYDWQKYFNGEDVFALTLRQVGCVYPYHTKDPGKLPPAELLAHFPGYVAAAWGHDFRGLVLAAEPKVLSTRDGLYAERWLRDLQASYPGNPYYADCRPPDYLARLLEAATTRPLAAPQTV